MTQRRERVDVADTTERERKRQRQRQRMRMRNKKRETETKNEKMKEKESQDDNLKEKKTFSKIFFFENFFSFMLACIG